MKIDLKKFRNGVSTVVCKQISFLCCELIVERLFWPGLAEAFQQIQHSYLTQNFYSLAACELQFSLFVLYTRSPFTEVAPCLYTD